MCADTLALNNNGKRRGGGLKSMAKNKQSLKEEMEVNAILCMEFLTLQFLCLLRYTAYKHIMMYHSVCSVISGCHTMQKWDKDLHISFFRKFLGKQSDFLQETHGGGQHRNLYNKQKA